jgi:hypothetical protein
VRQFRFDERLAARLQRADLRVREPLRRHEFHLDLQGRGERGVVVPDESSDSSAV